MTNKEAMQMALDALETIPYMSNKDDYENVARVITALRAALAKGEQEPVAWRIRCTDPMRDWVLMYRHPKTEEQFSNMEIQPLYNAPPQPNEFNPDWDAMAVMVEEQQRMAKRIEELEARLAQGEPEPVAWITTWNEKENAGVELHWAKLDKGASAKHTPLYTKEQLLDAAQKLADSAALNSFPPQREWQSVGTDAEILELSKDAWGREELKYGRTDHTQFYIDFARAIEAKLKEKNNG